MLLNQFLSLSLAFFHSFNFSLTDLKEKMKFAWTVSLLVLLFASTMDAGKRNEIRSEPLHYGENECIPCQSKLKVRGTPSVIRNVVQIYQGQI